MRNATIDSHAGVRNNMSSMPNEAPDDLACSNADALHLSLDARKHTCWQVGGARLLMVWGTSMPEPHPSPFSSDARHPLLSTPAHP